MATDSDAQLADFVLGRCAHVDPQLLGLRSLRAVLGVHEVDRFLADHADDVSIPAQDRDTLTYQNLWVPPANRRDVHEAIIVDVGDLQAYFIDVSREHDSGTSGWIHHCERIARNVGFHGAGEGLGLLTPNTGRANFEAGRPRGVEKPLEKGDVVTHGIQTKGVPGGGSNLRGKHQSSHTL